jgi:hypothetical protein
MRYVDLYTKHRFHGLTAPVQLLETHNKQIKRQEPLALRQLASHAATPAALQGVILADQAIKTEHHLLIRPWRLAGYPVKLDS